MQGDGSEGSSQGGGFTPDPQHPDYFQFFQTRQNCEDFNVDAAGAVPSAVNVACTPPFLDSPYGEIADLGAMYAENDVAISQIGPATPVLLTSGDHDTTAPPSAACADLAYYQAHCGCDVSQIILPATGHLFQVHASLAGWVKDVVVVAGRARARRYVRSLTHRMKSLDIPAVPEAGRRCCFNHRARRVLQLHVLAV